MQNFEKIPPGQEGPLPVVLAAYIIAAGLIISAVILGIFIKTTFEVDAVEPRIEGLNWVVPEDGGIFSV